MGTVELTKETFQETILAGDVVLVDFWASWCGPCRTFAPIYQRAAERHDEVVFAKVDTEAEPELAAAFRIMSIPTLMAFREGMLVFAQPGALPEQALDELIAKVSALDMDDVRRRLASAGAET